LGKILLANMDDGQRVLHLDPEPMPRYGPGTITSHAELFDQLSHVSRRGIAWEFGEFADGATCAAAAVRDASGALIGSVAVSAPNARFAHGRPEVEQALRATASRVSRFYRTNGTSRPFALSPAENTTR
jgi:DNA-binding IclR family transcriptional regulator